jgi:selenocysteine lyase/cysteine desulfurase
MEPPIDPRALRAHYTAFLRPGRVLLTGHSHQAWPDVAREGLLEAFEDAAGHVDDKWERAFAAADAVRDAVVARIGGRRDEVALGQNTHELVVRFLSALDWRRRRHLVTTAGEFHTIDRQLHRLAEEGVEVSFVDTHPVATLAERLAARVRGDTAAVLASTVLFGSSAVVPGLRELCDAAHRRGARVLLDAYHAFGVVPFRLEDFGASPVFLVAGGYKYAQWGEGVCFLRVPPELAELRPVYTGWFAAFGHLAAPRTPGEVGYGTTGAARFAGSTYDPASHYRARAVARFFDTQGLTVPRLAANYRRQTGRILAALEGWDVRTPRDEGARGGFVAVRVGNAAQVVERLRARGVLVDARGEVVRLGPAPYLTDEEIDAGVAAFVEVAERAGG